MAPLALSVKQAAAQLGISEWTVYREVKAGRLPSMRFGRRMVIPRAALEQYLAREADASLTSGDAS